jgi:hypothetical protein
MAACNDMWFPYNHFAASHHFYFLVLVTKEADMNFILEPLLTTIEQQSKAVEGLIPICIQ